MLANELKLDVEELTAALQEGMFEDRVRRDIQGGLLSGVQGWPTFFINGEQHVGPYEFEDLVDAIQQHMQLRRRRAEESGK